MAIDDSRQVHVADMVLVSARGTASTTVFERVVFDPANLQGLSVEGGSVDCSLCSIRGSINTFARRHQWSLTHPPVPSGLTITMQTVTFATTFELSLPTIVAFP